MKIRTKITWLFTFLVTVILLVLSGSVYYLTSVDTQEIFRNRLRNRASSNAQIFGYFGDASVSVLQRIDSGSLAILPRKSVTIYDTSGTLLYEYHAAGVTPLAFDKERLDLFREQGEEFFGAHDHRIAVGLYYPNAFRPIVIVVAAYDEDGRERLAQLRRVLLTSLLIGIFITLVTGYLFSSQLVRPIRSIIYDVNTISSNNLSKRLTAGSGQDELHQLARTFNELLDRLQDSFMTQRRFISNASHELSTPLTSILSQLQVTFQKPRSAEEYKKVLLSVQEDVEQMRQLTRSLLEIAKAGTQGTIELDEVRVDELLLKVIGDVKRSNPEYNVELAFDHYPESEEEVKLYGNFDLLYSALQNIVENGCKYSPDHSAVIHVTVTGPNIIIRVINNGDILVQEEIEQIFQPFYRGRNSQEIRGFGLGLPLARRIINLHKGNITVESAESKTVFIIEIPTLSPKGF